METKRYAEVSVLHIEPATYQVLLDLARTGPGDPGRSRYDPENPWHELIVEPHSDGCWLHTGFAEFGADPLIMGLPASLRDIGREAVEADATWILFLTDLTPMLDLPVYDHGDGPVPPGIES